MNSLTLVKLCRVCAEPFQAAPLEVICSVKCAWTQLKARESRERANAETEARFRKMAGGA